MQKILVGIGLFFVGRYILRKVDVASNITANITKVNYRFGFPFSTIVCELSINNPAMANVMVTGVNGAMFWNNAEIGKINSSDSVLIAKQTTSKLNVDVIVNNFTIVQTLIEAIQKKLKGTWSVKGTMVADNIILPINMQLSV